jgi:FkbM family methyltransferase
MGLTKELFPRAKKLYNQTIRRPGLDRLIHFFFNTSADLLSRLKGFSFPAKFTWEWKLEMLLQKYEKETTDFFKRNIRPGMTVIDIGAHVGYYAVLFSKLTGDKGKVYAFEADADNFILLEKNVGRRQNVCLINQAVSNQDGFIDFYKIQSNTGCHSLIAPSKSQTEKISVPTTTIDSFIEKNKLAKIDFIKIDIEGGEYLALLGMQKLFSHPDAPAIIMEFGPEAILAAKLDPQEFLKKIRNFGFRIFEILPRGEIQLVSPEDEITKFNYYRTGFVNLLLKK